MSTRRVVEIACSLFTASIFLLANRTASAQQHIICDTTCGPDPSRVHRRKTVRAVALYVQVRCGVEKNLIHLSLVSLVGFLVLMIPAMAIAQYTTSTGTPTFTTAIPVEMGFTNIANGNLHLEIPLASFPQRGNLPYNARLVYDSLIWTIQHNTWSPTNVPNSMGGWRLITGGEPGTVTSITTNNACDTPPPIQNRTVHTGFVWTAPDGTSHRFPIFTMQDSTICQEGVSSDTEMADDSSGFTMSVTNYSSAIVYAPDGTQVYPTVMDTNGNFFSNDGAGQIIDTVGRTPITVTTGTNTITYGVLNSQGTRTNITVTTATIPANTSFGQSGVTECQTNCTVTAISSIAFDDGTSYNFTYDSGTTSGHFAVLSSMKLRAGGTISYGYTTFADIPGNHSRWLSSKTDGTNVWNYTPQAQALTANQVTVAPPSGDHINYSFTLNNGAWESGATYVTAAGTVLLYLTNTWDTSNACPQNSGCSGAAFVRRLTSTTQFPDGLKKTLTYSYTSPVTGQVSEIDESDYSTGTPPILRKTLFTYAPLGNIVSKPAIITVEDGASPPNIGSLIKFTYDEPSYCCAPTTGTPQHMAVNAARGNATTTASLISGSTYSTTHRSYYDTGTLNTEADSKNNTTTFNYSDSIATCGNSYPTSITFPLGLSTSTAWNCSSGQAASTTDANNQITSFTYDSMNRLTQTRRPDNVLLSTQFNDTASPPNIAQSTTANSALGVSVSDSLGRVVQTQLLNGTTTLSTTATQIDALHNTVKISNPYGPADSPQWKTTVTDLLGRPLTVSPPSGGSYQYTYSDNITTITDPIGNQRRSFSDGLGRLVEVDEPGDSYPGVDATGSITVSGSLRNVGTPTQATGTVTISGTERTYTDTSDCNIVNGRRVCATAPDNGSVWITINGMTKTYLFGDGDTATSVASNLASDFNFDPASPVTATLSGTVITFASKASGSSTNYTLSCGQSSHANSFIPTASGATLTGGTDGGAIVYDSGTATLTLSNGFTASAPYGQSSNSTAANIAAALASSGSSGLNRTGSPVSATASGAIITITYNTAGTAGNVSVTLNSSTSDPGHFSGGSFCSPQCTSSLMGGDNPEAPSLDHNPYVTRYTYDVLDNLTKVSQGVQTRIYSYDGLGRIISSTMPESGTMTYSYVAADGSLCSGNTPSPCYITDARGVITTNTYDALNRLTKVSYNVGSTGIPATSTVSYTYGTDPGSNNNGRLLTMTDGAGAETNSYDLMGRIINVARSIGSTTYNIGYGYNSADQITSITYPSTRVVQQSYDAAGRLTSIASAGTTYISVPSNDFNASQQPLNISYGSGVTGSFGYNDHLQMSSLAYTKGSNTLLNLGYSYIDANGHNNGKIQGITDSRGPAFSTSYTYDALGRLSNAQTIDLSAASTWALAWSYDRYGNRLSQTLTGGTIAAGQPQLNVDTNTNRISTTGFGYDASGNLAHDPLYSYAYNAEGELANVNGTGPAYAYDGHRWRIQKTVSGTTTTYIYAGSKVIAEYTNGTLSKEYIYSGSRLLATIAGGAVTYHYPDHLSNRLETDAAGNVTRTFGHLPFGEIWYETGTPDKWKFTGYERDTGESKLDYALNRFYASDYGRFQSPDSLPGTAADPQSLNRFAYVTNDPGNQVDPDGRCGLIVGGINMDQDSQSGKDLIAEAAALGVNVAFPFDKKGKLAGIGDVFNEGVGLDTPADDVTRNAIEASDQDDGNGVQILAWSGGAATTSAVLNPDPSLDGTVSVTRVDYFSPGVINGSLFQTQDGQTPNGTDTQQTFMARGDGFFDWATNLTTAGQGKKTQIHGVGHNLNRALSSGTDAAERLLDDVKQNRCDHPTIFSTKNPKGVPNTGARESGSNGSGWWWVLSYCDDSGCTVLAMWPY